MDDMSLKVNCQLCFANQLLPEEQSRCCPINQNTHSRVLDIPQVLKTNGFVWIEVGDIVTITLSSCTSTQ
jgi:translation initiation factor IF-1